VAVADEGYRFGQLTGDVASVVDIHTAINMDGDYSITGDSVSQ
jgi:hypothetical protein